MIQLKDYQKKAIKELKQKIIDMLNQSEDRQKLVFKAPTGSGKTVMASALLDELTQELPQNGDCIYTRVAWVWIAPNKLHQQSYRSMRNYFSETRSLRPVMFDECDHLEGLQQGDVLFLNWESINKDNAVMIRDNEQNRTLFELLRRTRIQNNVPIVVVIDEEHMFGGRNAMKSEKVLKSINPKIELRISATPVTMSFQAVEVRRKDVVEEEMIKKGVELNPNVRSSNEQTSLTVNQQLLVKALKKREELAKAYAEYGINPLLLIQLPNDTSDTLSNEEKTIAEEMKAYLSEMCNISVENGKLAVWLSKDKSPNLDNITKADDMTEVLLFKQAIALGWDCPRASVLLIFRELKSMTFTTQTVGRILRMPEQRFYSDEALNKGYVYTNLSQDMVNVVRDDMNYMSKYVAYRKENLNNITLTAESPHSLVVRNRLGYDFRDLLKQTFKEQWTLNDVNLFQNFFDPKPQNDSEEEKNRTQIVHNRQQAGRFVDFDVKNIVTVIPKDMTIGIGEGSYKAEHKARMARTQGEVDTMFTLFCRNQVGSFAKKDSTPVLAGALMSVMEDFFEIFETDAKRIILYNKNRKKFIDVIQTALAKYKSRKELEARDAQTTVDKFDWIVPDTRTYNEDTHTRVKATMHAMQPFFALNRESNPEQKFREFLEQNDDCIDWWYKNGDSGKDNFSIVYDGIEKKKKPFYVDFVIRMNDGTICLFDTKTNGSDPEGVNKHNALYDWMQKEKEKRNIKLVGGIIIGTNDFTTWKYSPTYVDNIDKTDGWNEFNPQEYSK